MDLKIRTTKNILVTGSHRSGSTWVGKVLASNKEAAYIAEPFNYGNNIFKKNSPIKFWFPYFANDKDIEILKRYLGSTYNFKLGEFLRQIYYTPKGIFNLLKYELGKINKKRKIIKDPFAVFFADLLFEKFDFDILITIRHPAAFVESLKAKKWDHDFNHFFNQPELMGLLMPFRAEIEKMANNPYEENDIVEQGILLWNLIHYRIAYYLKKYPQWIFVKHEELSKEPEKKFAEIFNALYLSFNPSTLRYIRKTTKGTGIAGKNRNAVENSIKWKTKLNKIEKDKIYEGTKAISILFYNEESWI